jgi:dihydroorotate dehydrogenase (fumarate)
MFQTFAKINHAVYRSIIRPLLFTIPADTVHESLLRVGSVVQRVPLTLPIIRALHAYSDPSLAQTIAGINYPNPIGLSAGFDKEVRLPKLMQAVGYGFVEVGSITAQPYSGNPKPWYSRLPHTKSIVVNSGLRSSGVEAIANRADKRWANFSQNFCINASVAKTNSPECNTVEKGMADYCASLRRLERSPWPQAYTINISCPNTSGGEPFNKPENLAKLLQAIDNLQLSRPVFLKLPIDLAWQEIKPLLDIADKSSLTGLTLGNLSKDRSLVDPRDTLLPEQKGNLSGKPCWNASNELLARSYVQYGDRFIYSGVGGVFTAEDAYTKIKLGASLVEIITGMIYGGPAVVGLINKGLSDLLKKDGYTHISEAIGVDALHYIQGLDS